MMADEPLFSDADVIQRCFDLHGAFEAIKAVYEARTSVVLGIDPSALYLVVCSYFDDIARFKRYHLPEPQVQKADPVKQAAFMVKWLVRIKPIYVERKHDLAGGVLAVDPEDVSVLINEGFAISVGSDYLGCYIAPPKYREVLYDLCYRRLTDDGLLLFFQTLKDIRDGRAVIAT